MFGCSRLISIFALCITLTACASSAPPAALPVSAATPPGDAVFLRLYRSGFEALTCPYDDTRISCGAYLLDRFAKAMQRQRQIEELSLSVFSFTCVRVGDVVKRKNCTVTYRLDYRLNGQTLMMNITASKEKTPLPALGGKSKSTFKFLRALLDQSVKEFETTVGR